MGEPFFLYDEGIQLLLFGGKGGVGKTSCATATALKVAKRFPGRSLLLVSTDPAHSLADSMADISTPLNMKVLELDAQVSLASFKKDHNEKLRQIAMRGTFLDDEDIRKFLDLSLPGLDELMAFMEISRWVVDRQYDCVVVDTAPTGHTLRLLSIPDLIGKWLEALDTLLAKHRYMKQLFSGSYQGDEVDSFLLDLSDSVRLMKDLLRDRTRCRFIPVMIAEDLSIRETINLLNELEQMRIPVTDIVINRLYSDSACPVCLDERSRQMKRLVELPEYLFRYFLWGLPLFPWEVRGQVLLQYFWESVYPLEKKGFEFRNPAPSIFYSDGGSPVESPGNLPSPEMKFLLFAGKGGVGKTTLSCATAIRLARDNPGKGIFLFSTDPAHSLSFCLGEKIGSRPTRILQGLTAMEIDAHEEFESLKREYGEELERFLKGISPNMDLTFDREVMEKLLDLSPPGLDEVMALTWVMALFNEDRYDTFILDSAPTGHLIRLLETPEIIDQWLKAFFHLFLKYRRIFRLPRISDRLVRISKDLKIFRALMKESTRSGLYCVTIPTEMAFEETKDLMSASKRMGVHVPLMFLNLVTAENDCALCRSLHKREMQVKEKIQKTFKRIQHITVYRRGELQGLTRLGELGDALYR